MSQDPEQLCECGQPARHHATDLYGRLGKCIVGDNGCQHFTPASDERESGQIILEGKTLRQYLESQFPATVGHIPLQMYYEAEARNTTRITQLESDLESVGSKYEKLLLEHADAITKLNRYSEAELLGETERCRWEKDKKLSEDRRQMLEKLSELGSVLVMMDSKEQDKLRALATKKD